MQRLMLPLSQQSLLSWSLSRLALYVVTAIASAVIFIIGAWLWTVAAAAHDHARQEYHPDTLKWFKTLSNRLGHLCCDGTDSITPNGWRIGSKGYEVMLYPGGPWLEVPNTALVVQPNLLNEVHVWPVYDAQGNVWFRCFMPGAGG